MSNLFCKNDILQPPNPAEKVLTFLLTQENAESVLGDFAEIFNAYGHQGNVRKAKIWYWMQVIRSAPALLNFKLLNELERRLNEMTKNINSHKMPSIWISLIALMPALVLVIPGIMQSGIGYFGANNALDTMFAKYPALGVLHNPFLLLGGLLLAFLVNITPAIHLRIERQPEGLTSIITFKPVLLHWIFAGTSILLVGIILIYAFLENFQPAFH